MQKVEIHISPDMSKDGLKHSTPRLPEVAHFPRCNNADIDLYMRIPSNPSLVDPKGEMLLDLDDEDAIL